MSESSFPLGPSERRAHFARPTEFHPVQIYDLQRYPNVPADVALRAYEVYCYVHGEQPAMVTGDCRGGFGAGELIAFLYAHTFPKYEWRERVEFALCHVS